MKDICTIKPHLFENNLVISLSSKWIQIIGQISTFKATVDHKNRICLIGPKIPNWDESEHK